MQTDVLESLFSFFTFEFLAKPQITMLMFIVVKLVIPYYKILFINIQKRKEKLLALRSAVNTH